MRDRPLVDIGGPRSLEVVAFIRPEGFELARIRVPVLLWQGRHDLTVPAAHGAWLASHMPGVDARLTPEDGHVTICLNGVPDTPTRLKVRFKADRCAPRASLR